MAFLQPDRYFARVTRISPAEDLVGCGFEFMLLDMDNTILSRASHDIPLDVKTWLRQVREAGVGICLLSNNWHSTPYEWAAELDLPVVAKACKPLPHGYIAARAKLGAKSANTVVVGDQLSTDVVGAHLLGMKAYLVCPLVEQDLRHTVVLRNFERALLGARTPEGAQACTGDTPTR
ncbi:MAG: HAD hydrolase-like protein [Eggerthellaceae bacterium]|nr:HAD hydrolase-like protein [Eggerthellaceae bacterium]